MRYTLPTVYIILKYSIVYIVYYIQGADDKLGQFLHQGI